MVSLSFHYKRLLSSAFIGLCALALLASPSSLIPAHAQQDHDVALDCTQFPNLVAKTESTYQGNAGCLYAEIAQIGDLPHLILDYAEQSFGLQKIVLMQEVDDYIRYYNSEEGKVQVDDPSEKFSLLHELTHFVADEIFDHVGSPINREERTNGRLRRQAFSLLWPRVEHDPVQMRREIDIVSANVIREAISIKETSTSWHHDKISQKVLSNGYRMVNYSSKYYSTEAIARAVESSAAGKNHPMVTQIFGPTLDYIDKYMRPALDHGPGESFLTNPQFRKAFTDTVISLITKLDSYDAFNKLPQFLQEVRYDGMLLKDIEAAVVAALERVLEKIDSSLWLTNFHKKLGAFITQNNALKKAFDHKLAMLIKGSNTFSLSFLQEMFGTFINQNDTVKQAFEQRLITLIKGPGASLASFNKSLAILFNQNDTMKHALGQRIITLINNSSYVRLLIDFIDNVNSLSDLYERFGKFINQNDLMKQAVKQRFMALINDSDGISLSFLHERFGTFINQNDFMKQAVKQRFMTLINDSDYISLYILHYMFSKFINQN